MKLYENYNWGLNDEMNSLLNNIDLKSDKRVLLTSGDKQFIYDNGEIYKANSMNLSKGIKISRAEFWQQTEEIKQHNMFNKKNDIIIE